MSKWKESKDVYYFCDGEPMTGAQVERLSRPEYNFLLLYFNTAFSSCFTKKIIKSKKRALHPSVSHFFLLRHIPESSLDFLIVSSTFA
jgi:hypothetical protein